MFSVTYLRKYFNNSNGECTADKKYQRYRMKREKNYCAFLANRIEFSEFWDDNEKKIIKLVMTGEKIKDWYIISEPISEHEIEIYVIYTKINVLKNVEFVYSNERQNELEKDIEILRKQYIENNVEFLTKLARLSKNTKEE